MREGHHETIARWERRWLAIEGVMLVVFVIFMALALTLQGDHIAHMTERGTPDDLQSLPYFEDPGPRQVAVNRYEVGIMAQAFSFSPSTIRLPAGTPTTFFLTSADVLHGFQVEGTNINVEVIPGEISTFDFTFDEPGSYRIACNEYCGIGHQNMLGTIEVLSPREFDRLQAQAQDPSAEVGGDDTVAASVALGSDIYSSNCAGCHQGDGSGLAGVFPPLAEHAAHLYSAEGGHDFLVNVLLFGMQGPIEAAGATYDGDMPAWSQLSDAEIAGTLNFVLQSFGNDEILGESFEPYEAEEIEPFRVDSLTPQQVHDLRTSLQVGE